MNAKLTKVLSTMLSILIYIILLTISFNGRSIAVFANIPTSKTLEIIVLVPTQTIIPTPTLSPSPTFTPTQTTTPTPTLSPSPTLTPTSPCPSVQDIRNALSQDFSEIKELIDQRAGPQTWGENLGVELVGSVLWESLTVVFLLSLPIVGKIALKLKLTKGKAPSETDKMLNSVLDAVIITYSVVLVLLLFSLSLSRKIDSQALGKTDLNAIVERLERIESKLQVQPNVDITRTPIPTMRVFPSSIPTNSQTLNPYAKLNPIITSVLLLSLSANVLLVLIYGKRKSQPEAPEFQPITKKLHDLPDKELFAAILLALVILLLPYPTDTFLLPFIIQYFIFAFFDIVHLYPNQHLKEIVIRRYSLLIFFAEFGVWFSFLSALRNFLYPVWNIIHRIIVQGFLADFVRWLDSSWEFAPLVLAVIIAVPSWLRLKKLSKEKAIPKILESIDAIKNSKKTI